MSSSSATSNRVSSNEAIAHAISSDYFKLFGTIAVGWGLLQGGTILLGSGFEGATPDGWAILFGLTLALGGAGVFFVGIVALAHKLFVEAQAATAD